MPPLHPRCRCAIMYREVRDVKPKDKPRSNEPAKPVINPVIPAVVSQPLKPKPDEKEIRAILEAVRAEQKIKGELIYPPPELDFSEFTFDAEHTQGDKHPHDVTEEEARRFIKEAYFAIILQS